MKLYIFLLSLFFTNAYFYPHISLLKNKLYSKKKTSCQNENIILPKSSGQEEYINDLDNNKIKILLGIGPAGTGKTFLACQYAIKMLNLNLIDKLVLTRPLVSADEELGFLPGNLIKKMDPWTKPLYDALKESVSGKEISNYFKKEVIEICPLAYMRGRTFKNSLIIADEMQNSTPNQMYMLTSRLGYNSKLIITGDLLQSDLKEQNGLIDITSRINHYTSVIYNNNEKEFSNNMNIKICLLRKNDIQRSAIVSNIINLYDSTNRK